MVNNLELAINQSNSDSNNLIGETSSYTITDTWTEKQVGQISIASGTTYTQINYVDIGTSNYVRVSSNQALTAWLINGATSSPVAITTDLILKGTTTGLWLNNASGTTAIVSYDIRS